MITKIFTIRGLREFAKFGYISPTLLKNGTIIINAFYVTMLTNMRADKF